MNSMSADGVSSTGSTGVVGAGLASSAASPDAFWAAWIASVVALATFFTVFLTTFFTVWPPSTLPVAGSIPRLPARFSSADSIATRGVDREEKGRRRRGQRGRENVRRPTGGRGAHGQVHQGTEEHGCRSGVSPR